VIYFGSTSPAMDEALVTLAAAGIHLDALRLRAFPFPASGARLHRRHDAVFVVEQNRDAQMRTLLINELEVDPAQLVPMLHYDGTPITARFITSAITDAVHAMVVLPAYPRANMVARHSAARPPPSPPTPTPKNADLR
jgi:2-oxoglutarate ferredoxin oxidoreductase subunit alpha